MFPLMFSIILRVLITDWNRGTIKSLLRGNIPSLGFRASTVTTLLKSSE